MRFWAQFETQIDKSNAPEVTKFSYLKELVNLKVCNLIDGLPFTEEGYTKAKDILCRRYRNNGEVIGTYVRNILELPVIRDRDVKKFHERVTSVQCGVPANSQELRQATRCC